MELKQKTSCAFYSIASNLCVDLISESFGLSDYLSWEVGGPVRVHCDIVRVVGFGDRDDLQT